MNTQEMTAMPWGNRGKVESKPLRHTKGPWQVLADPEWAGKHVLHDHRYIATDDATWEETERTDGNWFLLDGSIIAQMRDTANQAGDAKLIAAAPDLLAFVRGIAGCVKWSESIAGLGTPSQAIERAITDQRIERARELVRGLPVDF